MTGASEIKELNRQEMGRRIRMRREVLGMSREELAKRLDVTAKFVADLEYGDKGPSVRNLYRLKQILGVSVDYLFDGNTASKNEEEPRKMLSENIMEALSVCSVKQLRVMDQIAQLYTEEAAYDEEPDKDKR